MHAESRYRCRSKTHLLQPGNSIVGGCAALALLVTSLWPGVARAHGNAGEPGDPGVESLGEVGAPRRIELLARGSYANLSVGLLGLGIEGTYFASPHFGVGGAVEAIRVDLGGEPVGSYWYDPGTLTNGIHALLSVEVDAFDYWLTPFARASAGAGAYARVTPCCGGPDTTRRANFVGQLQLGIAVRGGPIVGKFSVAPTLYGSDAVLAYSAGLGARF
jgi:hypothetical protein